ncbi:MAG TPA: antibiotic biosynthesis monooxygenase [Acidothermaceae bacterium]|nr:antibiotic biosynthesis monooxygenase [Acidothermaceae bacterium]
MIARMWEAHINAGELDEFCEWARAEAWPQFASAQGFLGGELYRSDEQQSAVVVTRWSDADALAAGNNWFDLGAERFCAREANAWEFTPVQVG